MVGKVFINNVYPRNIVKDNRQVKKMFKDNVQVWPTSKSLNDFSPLSVDFGGTFRYASTSRHHIHIDGAMVLETDGRNLNVNQYRNANPGGTATALAHDSFGCGLPDRDNGPDEIVNQNIGSVTTVFATDNSEVIININQPVRQILRIPDGLQSWATAFWFKCNNCRLTINFNARFEWIYGLNYGWDSITSLITIIGTGNTLTINSNGNVPIWFNPYYYPETDDFYKMLKESAIYVGQSRPNWADGSSSLWDRDNFKKNNLYRIRGTSNNWGKRTFTCALVSDDSNNVVIGNR